jgi:NAD(P)H-nitrite reductase large subunit
MTKPVVDKAVIVGGGLGGLAAAIQLRKIGIDVQVSRLGWVYLSSVFFSFTVFHCYLSVS